MKQPPPNAKLLENALRRQREKELRESEEA
jgi:hypothetical protein